jgi:hypothetical protein
MYANPSQASQKGENGANRIHLMIAIETNMGANAGLATFLGAYIQMGEPAASSLFHTKNRPPYGSPFSVTAAPS